MLIRPVQEADKLEWLRMRLALWPDEESGPDEESRPDSSAEHELEEIERFLAGYPLPTLMAAFVCDRPEGGLCGLVEVSIHTSAPGCQTDRIGYLEAWYVDPDWRRSGLGRALAERAESWARAAGCLEMASDTTPFYPHSPAAHASLGYEEVERYFRKDL
jgi:aminoglycoside 6'-N-acetyltransferase I